MSNGPDRQFVSARDVDRLPRGATLRVSPRAIITPWARDRAAVRGITITECEAAPEVVESPSAPAAAASCGCPAPAETSQPAAPAPKGSVAWISPFQNRMLRGPDVSVLLGAAAASTTTGY